MIKKKNLSGYFYIHKPSPDNTKHIRKNYPIWSSRSKAKRLHTFRRFVFIYIDYNWNKFANISNYFIATDIIIRRINLKNK